MSRAAVLLAICALAMLARTQGALKTDKYTIQNAGRGACPRQLLGFNNRTCEAGTKTRPAGPGVGPTLRAATATNAWATLTVTVTGTDSEGDLLAALSTFVAEGAAQPLCVGNVVAEKPSTCADPRAHIHPAAQAGSATLWALHPVGNTGRFTIRYTGRDAGCAVFLTASAACGTNRAFLAPADASALQEWVLTSTGVSPSPMAFSPPPPLAGQAPLLNVSNVTATSALLTVTPAPGGCTPVSYQVSHAPANSLAVPSVATVPAGAYVTSRAGNLKEGETYDATAAGVCADGTRTPSSAAVRFTARGRPPPSPPANFPTQHQKLWAYDSQQSSYFGYAIDLDGDYAVFGAKDADTELGATYVFKRTAGRWAQAQKIDGVSGKMFGWAVSISGTTLVASAKDDNRAGNSAGAVCIYIKAGSLWVLDQTLLGSEPSEEFGSSVSLNGNTLAVGAPGTNGSGFVTVYTRADAAAQFAPQQTVTGSQVKESFGQYGVALQGDVLVVGAHNANGVAVGAVYLFLRIGATWNMTSTASPQDLAPGNAFGWYLALDGDTLVVGANYQDDVGAAYVYTNVHSGTLAFQEKLQYGTTADRFGGGVAIEGDRIIIGAAGANSNVGRAYMFVRNGVTWTETSQFNGFNPVLPNGSSDPVAFGQFGFKGVALQNTTLMVGAPASDAYPDTGTVYGTGAVYVIPVNATGAA